AESSDSRLFAFLACFSRVFANCAESIERPSLRESAAAPIECDTLRTFSRDLRAKSRSLSPAFYRGVDSTHGLTAACWDLSAVTSSISNHSSGAVIQYAAVQRQSNRLALMAAALTDARNISI